jgi:hypothetical protein
MRDTISRAGFIKFLSDELETMSDGELLMIADIVGVDADCKVHGEFEVKDIDWLKTCQELAKRDGRVVDIRLTNDSPLWFRN